MTPKVLFRYILLCLIWGTTWYAIKVSLNYGTPPLFGAGLRFLIAGMVLWLLLWYRRETIPLNRVAVQLYLQFGLLTFGISYAITYWATQFIYSNLSAILWAGFPLMVSIFAHFSLPDDKFTTRKIVSISMGLVGVILIVANGQALVGHQGMIGIIAILIAVTISAWPNIYLKKHQKIVNAIQLNAVAQTLAGVVLVGVSLPTESLAGMALVPGNWAALLYLAVCGSVVTWVIYIWLFDHLSVTQISYVALFPPLVATFTGWLLLDESLNAITILGAVMILIGAWIINRTTRKSVKISADHI